MSNTFWFPADFELELGGAAQKADTNFEVLQLIKTLEQDGRSATTEEQELLSHYVGWGDSRVFRLKELDLYDLLTGDEMSAVRASTLNAHYTALPIIQAMWSGLLRLGTHKLDTLRILDPSAGIGHFRSASPEILRNISRWVEIELDQLTARILEQLHPNVEGQSAVFNAAFEDVKLITNQFDVAISNVPFGNYPIVDRTVKEAALKANIHDYFFVKALTLLKPGGVIAFITSRYTLDKKNSAVREWLARRADLLAAVRLPDTAFVANAGTEVVTDIIFLRKRKELREGRLPDWIETTELDSGSYDKMDPDADGKIRHNRIYAEHPEWIVGDVSTRRGMYTANEYTVKYAGETPIAGVVTQILDSALPQDGMLDIEASPEEIDAVVELVPPSHVVEIPENAPVDHLRRLEGLREVYDAAQRLLDMELNAHNLLEVGGQRHLLNNVYDRFVQRYGPVSNKLNQKLISKSAALPFLLALEVDYQPLTNSAVKAPIFHEATIRSFPSTDGIKGCNDALLYCLNRWGYVDINKIAELADITVEQALDELGDKVLFTPEGDLVPAEVYLIGNVREKLKQCEALVNIEPRLKATIEALHKAMPKPLKPGEIKARLGSGWVPAQYVKEFIEELFPGLEMMVTYMPKLGTWTVSVKRGFIPSENTTKWGTARYGGLALLEDGLNAKTPVVYDTIEEGGKERRVLNKRETIAAQAKLEELKTRFDTWLWQDAVRAEHLAKIYNEEVNVFARPRFDGAHLSLPGLSKDIEPRPLQKDAVWFALQRNATLVGDEVGLGKTLTAIISVMEAIRLGSAHKAMFAVPNHLTTQWQDAFLLAYPNARVLCAGKDDLKKKNRQTFMSRIATGKWDAIIVPQSSFKLLPVDPDTMNSFIQAELDELKAFLQQLKADKGYDQRARKEIEKAIKRFEAKLVNKSDMAKDSTDTITWDKLGIDMLVVDEFHCLPYEARVLTDRGLIPIGEIVDKRLPVRVKSVDLATREVKWMPVTDWFNNPQSAPMVRVVHERGVLECTANHKVWTEEEGYVEAGKLTKEHTLKNLPGMQKGVYFQPTRESGTETNPLFAGMLEKARIQNGNKALPAVWEGIHLPLLGQKEQRQEKVLRYLLCSQVADGAAGTQGISEGLSSSCMGSITSDEQRQTQPRGLSPHEGEQSNEKPRSEKTNVGNHVWPHVSGSRWQWDIDPATGDGGECVGITDGICHPHETGEGPIQVPAHQLQSGHCRPDAQAGDRDRWSHTQQKEMEVFGQAQDGGVERSRVVGVTFLESESGFRSGRRAQGDQRVYCLEVAGTHNFFAEGVLVSNCYKNLYFHTKMTRIAGLPNADSQRAFDMFVKVRNLLQKQGHFIGLTGTPISNTMAEAFTLLRYLAYDMLEDMGLSHFDSWAQMFADAVMMPEMTPDGSGFRVNTRLARFTNIPELAGMLSQFMIMRRFKEVSEQLDRPDLYGGKPTSVLMPGSKALKAYVNYLAERAEEVRGGKIDPRDDNMLKIISEGRKAALDLRLLFPAAPDLATSKINTSAWIIAEIYKRTTAFKSAQLVFCDLGTPKPHRDSVKMADADEDAPIAEENDEEPTFENTYADLKAKLVVQGVRADEIAFIHDAKTPTARAALFETVRNGRIRVLIGSTEKMGTGMNVQTRAIAMHHLDAPWRPADLEQRDGRLVRQGNIYPEVFSFVYITEGSFDSYVWQILETKARFIEQFMTGNTGVREIEDIGDTVLSMAEIKALASGNPRIIDRVMVQNEMMKLDQLRTSWQDERRRAQRKVSSVKQELEQVKVRIGHLNTGAKVRDAHPVDKDNFSMTVNGRNYAERREAGKALIEEGRIVKLDAERSGREARRKVGGYRGFVMWLRAKPNSERGMESLVTDPNGGIDVILDYGVPQVLVAHVSDSDVGTVSSVDSAIRSIDGEIKKNTERHDFLIREVESLSVRANEPWEHAERFESLAGRLKELDEELIKDGIDLTGDKVVEGKDSETVEGEEQPEEIQVVAEKPAVDTSAWLTFDDEPVSSVDFDLQSILMRIDEIHASMTIPEEEEVPSFAPEITQPTTVSASFDGDLIPATQTTIDDLLRKAEEARALAEFTSAVSSTQMRVDDLLDMGLTKQSTTTRRAKKIKVPEGQLSLF